jgi:hypothetical protein
MFLKNTLIEQKLQLEKFEVLQKFLQHRKPPMIYSPNRYLKPRLPLYKFLTSPEGYSHLV